MNQKRLSLGTAQFGLDYGINNKRGRIPPNEVFEILNFAKEIGIDTIDTAHEYGESERIIGDYLKTYKTSFKIISKFKDTKNIPIAQQFNITLNNLKISKLYGYLFHNFNDFVRDKNLYFELSRLKKENKVEKIGFSLYYPKELEELLKNNVLFDIIQIPYNLFDRRFEDHFSELKKRKIEIYVRSIFLQGLFFTKPEDLKREFNKIKDKIDLLHKEAKKRNLSVAKLCLDFVFQNQNIDKIVIGIDSINHFKELVNYAMQPCVYLDNLSNLICDDEQIILPFNWINL